MLDLDRLNRIVLTPRPTAQRIVGHLLLTPTYYLPRRVVIDLENFERVPKGPVIYAMNHTDRFNYWPFQYRLWRTHNRFTATWVKGKYYEQAFVARFMEWTNNIPTVSRGYLIARDFIGTLKRRPNKEEYRLLRDWVTAVSEGQTVAPPDEIPAEIRTTERNMLGRHFNPQIEDYPSCVNNLFGEMMRRFVELNRERLDKGLDLLVFPQGTRSIRLSRGRIGLAQMALYLKQTIVPIGCSGCDKVYPGASPLARGGHVIYRVGEPLHYEDLSEFHLPDYEPFTPQAESAHRETFQALVDLVMQRINELVDEPYRFSEDEQSGGVVGSYRFV